MSFWIVRERRGNVPNAQSTVDYSGTEFSD
jgi:hypothetical protein